MSTETVGQKKVSVSSSLSFKGVVVANVNKGTSKNGNELIFVTLACKQTFKNSPSMLYFGDLEFEKVQELQGQTVDVDLNPSNQNFTIAELIAV